MKRYNIYKVMILSVAKRKGIGFCRYFRKVSDSCHGDLNLSDFFTDEWGVFVFFRALSFVDGEGAGCFTSLSILLIEKEKMLKKCFF